MPLSMDNKPDVGPDALHAQKRVTPFDEVDDADFQGLSQRFTSHGPQVSWVRNTSELVK